MSSSALPTVGERAPRSGPLDARQPEKADGSARRFLHHWRYRAGAGPAVEVTGIAGLHREPQVLEDGERRKQVGDLERAGRAPQRQSDAAACPVMSTPREHDAAAIGNEQSGIRLKSVVLPAPLGPISACSVRSATATLASSSAWMPPNALASLTLRARRSPRVRARREECRQRDILLDRAAPAIAADLHHLGPQRLRHPPPDADEARSAKTR